MTACIDYCGIYVSLLHMKVIEGSRLKKYASKIEKLSDQLEIALFLWASI